MYLERSYLLINSLTKKELEQLDFVIKNKKRDGLKNLHKFIQKQKKTSTNGSKDKIYKAIFSETYTKEKDYLLRNEIRLYNNEIKLILAASGLLKNSTISNQLYIDELNKRNVKELVETEFKKTIASEVKNMKYGHAADLFTKLFAFKNQNRQYNTQYFNTLKEDLNTTYNYRLTQFSEDLSTIACNTAYVEAILNQLNQTNTFSNLTENTGITPFLVNTPLASLNFLKAETYKTQGEEKINILNKITKLIEQINHPEIDAQNEQMLNNLNMATTYMLIAEYNKATSHYEKVLQSNKLKENAYYLKPTILNYVSTLCKAKNISQAKQVIDQYAEIINSAELRDRVLPIAICINILSNDLAQAEALMPYNLKIGETDSYHYFRILLCILHYENKQLELAINEAKNITEHFRKYKDNILPLDIDICKMIIQFVKIEFNYVDEAKQKKLAQLTEQLNAFANQNKQFDNDSLIVLWLRKKLGMDK